MSTTTTTEISSNSNSSCRLLVCLNSLPSHDQRVFRSLLGHIELVRLSACCRSLTSSVRNDRALWQALYHRDFLSGAYYDKEMDFVLWCIRTDVNNPCTSDKRADLLENVDWYNTYRRRVSTENNWRYGRCNITRIDMEHDKDGVCHSTEAERNSLVMLRQGRSNKMPDHNYSLEYLPHSNLRSSNNIEYNSTLSSSPNLFPLGSGADAQCFYVLGDHYIAVRPYVFESNTHYNVKILSRKHYDVFTTLDVPIPYEMLAVEGKWLLLVCESKDILDDSLYISDIMVFDIDNNIMCPGNIDDTWDVTRFYKTTNNTVIVYTGRIVKDDDVDRIEWALYQFSNNNPVVQLRNGWFHLPKEITATSIYLAHNSYDSHIIIKLHGHTDYNSYIMHSVASNGQSHTPRNCYTITDRQIPIPLLKIGHMYLTLNSKPTKIWTDLSCNDNQVLRIPDITFIRHIIGDFYVFTVTSSTIMYSRLLVNINTKEMIHKLEIPKTNWPLDRYSMVGMMYSSFDSPAQTIHEYGEL